MWEEGERRWDGLGSVFSRLDADQIREEVERECRGRIVVAGLAGVGKSTLFNRLRGWEVSPVAGRGSGAEELGLFRLLDLPVDGPAGAARWAWGTAGWEGGEVEWGNAGPSAEEALAEANLVVFVLDAASGVRPGEYGWLSLVRALGKPFVAVLNKVDSIPAGLGEICLEVERRLATRVLRVSAVDGTGVEALTRRMLQVCPTLAAPLGRELVWMRRPAAWLLIRQAVFRSALAGLEPIPLLDLPVQMAVQQRLVMRLAALYGQPPSEGREVLAALAGGIGLRVVVQQLVKLAPVLGWGISAGLSGLSTLALGGSVVLFYEREAEVEAGWWERVAARLARVPKPHWRKAHQPPRPGPGGRFKWLRRRGAPGGDDVAAVVATVAEEGRPDSDGGATHDDGHADDSPGPTERADASEWDTNDRSTLNPTTNGRPPTD